MSSPFSFRALGLSSLLQLSGGAFATFLSFSASARKSSRSFDSLFNVNRRNLRFYSPPAQGLHGFRIRLHGRFTRKQIASSYNFQDGIISLNSMDSFIDYGFSTIPIRNSSIGIKVWLNRDYNSPSYDATLAF